MLKAIATVVAIQGRRITLQSAQQSSCGHCQHQSHCATGVVSKAIGGKVHQWQLESELSLQVGQQVELGLTERSLLHAAALVYLLPILGLFVGAIVGQWLFAHELAAIAGGLLVALGSLWLSRRLAQRWQQQLHYQPQILRILSQPAANCGESFIER
ncbi:Protein RseC [Vibrio stylophorae]|uniref:Protein RseC n=1 Tax=Vibrio stylophorae TaxID=659351 RepID=A0ABN8DTH2_9VIBR|nr:SoxR reducing system RseC family protein [Vibrio stylophorae]CAH0534369.1 Protein RseC [Vibrio stylophorae]